MEGVPQTGFGRVSNQILSYLHSRGHEIYELAVGYMGQYMSQPLPWPTYSSSAHSRLEGQDVLPLIANATGVDAVLMLCDVPDLYLGNPIAYRDRREGAGLREEMLAHIDAGRWKKLAYTVIDSAAPNSHLPADWEPIFKGYDSVAVATKWAQGLVEKEFGIKPMYIPHGVDTSKWKGMDKAHVRPQFGIDPEAFVIMGVGVNRKRKNIPAWFETVAKFAERVGDAKILFWLNSYRVPEDPGYDLKALSDHYELARLGVQAILTERLPEDVLPSAMSCADIGINESNEGFGMVPLEFAACRVPCVIMDYASTETVTDALDSFLKIPVKSLIPQPGNVICWGWPDTDVAADRMAEYFRDKKLRTTLKRSSWEHAQKYSWNNVLPKFEHWLEETVNTETSEHMTVEVI